MRLVHQLFDMAQAFYGQQRVLNGWFWPFPAAQNGVTDRPLSGKADIGEMVGPVGLEPTTKGL